MIRSQAESELFYDHKKQAANKEGLPVGEVIRNVVKYFKFNHPCTPAQALAWAALELHLRIYRPTSLLI
jgi:hypothetical protein